MTTIEMHHARKGHFGNGLVMRGFVRETVRRGNPPESVLRGWTFGWGQGISSVARHPGSGRLEIQVAGGEA
ncbi:MAG: hypothetical protein HQL95_16015 [Magnetococcales bacterium]|nr:hypothetical protein [Magnetococcales bacterium]